MKGVIENWWTAPGGNGFTAPEIAGIVICGDFEGRPIRTSSVVRTEGKTVYTRNSVYQLGSIEPKFLNHLKTCGYKFDPENPIRLVNKLTVLEPKPN